MPRRKGKPYPPRSDLNLTRRPRRAMEFLPQFKADFPEICQQLQQQEETIRSQNLLIRTLTEWLNNSSTEKVQLHATIAEQEFLIRSQTEEIKRGRQVQTNPVP